MNNQTNKPLYKNRKSAFDYYLVIIFALALLDTLFTMWRFE